MMIPEYRPTPIFVHPFNQPVYIIWCDQDKEYSIAGEMLVSSYKPATLLEITYFQLDRYFMIEPTGKHLEINN